MAWPRGRPTQRGAPDALLRRMQQARASAPKIESLQDTFNAVPFDSGKWFANTLNGGFPDNGMLTQSAGTLTLTNGDTFAFNDQIALCSNLLYDLIGSSIYVKPVFNTIATGEYEGGVHLAIPTDAEATSDTAIFFVLDRTSSADTLFLSIGNGGSFTFGDTSVTYSPTDHAWWRIRETGGTVFWEAAPDNGGVPGAWAVLTSTASSDAKFDLTQLRVKLYFRMDGTATAAGEDTITFDGVNAPAGDVVTHATSGVLAAAGVAAAGAANRTTVVHVTHAATAVLRADGAKTVSEAGRNVHTTPSALLAGGSKAAGRASRLAPAGTESVQDAFDAASIDGVLWNTFAVNAGSLTQSGGTLNPVLSSGAVGTIRYLFTFAGKTLASSFFYARLVRPIQAAGGAIGAETALTTTDKTSGDSISWSQQGDGTIAAQWAVGGVTNTQFLTYSPITHAWLRVRERGGTVFWDHAPLTAQDPPMDNEWVNAFSQTLTAMGWTAPLTNMDVGIITQIWNAAAGVPTQNPKWDGFNTRTAAIKTHDATGALKAGAAAASGANSKRVTHATTAVLRAQPSAAGAAPVPRAHILRPAPIDLVAGSAIIVGISASDASTRRVWTRAQDTAGEWSGASPSADEWTLTPDSSDEWTRS